MLIKEEKSHPGKKKSGTESEDRNKTVELPSVRHRPKDKPNEQTVIGMQGVKKLRMHLDGELLRLKIEEESFDQSDDYPL